MTILTILMCGSINAAVAATYYVAANGNDANDGKSIGKAWRTLEHVNATHLKPGDSVLFRRGDVWRGSLHPASGSNGHPIVYGAYGRGAKPVFLGSVARNSANDWHHEGDSIWSTGGTPDLPTVPPTAVNDFEKAVRWSIYTENGAAAQIVQMGNASSPAAVTVKCSSAGKILSDIQLIAPSVHLRRGQSYRLVLRARASSKATVSMPSLMRSSAPWTGYSTRLALGVTELKSEWKLYCQYYRSDTTTEGARLTIYLGSALPAGCSFEIDRFQFAECADSEVPKESALPVDVGNIIFGREQFCGVKVWKRADLNAEGKFWYDYRTHKLLLFCLDNPARRYKEIECALYRHIIDEGGASFVVYDGFALKNGGAHGIGGGSTHHITVRNCDISYIGGANQFGEGQTVRFGNGVEFWGDAHDNLVERCRLWEIYDAALTNQNMGAIVRQENIVYRNNIIWNSEYSFEYWNRPAESLTRNIQFIHNTCYNAGHGWGHAQRPDPSGRHLCFYDSQANESGIVIANNIFCEATGNAFYAPTWSRKRVEGLQLDGNAWKQQSGEMMWVAGTKFAMAQFAAYQALFNKDVSSVAADPQFVDASRGDFHLANNSPCKCAGIRLDMASDFEGHRRTSLQHPDAGALVWTKRKRQ